MKTNNDDDYKTVIDYLKSETMYDSEFGDDRIDNFNDKRYEYDDEYKTYIDELKKITLYDKEFEKYRNFPCMKQYFNEHMDLLCRKGFYPYEFIDNDEKLNYNGLPPKEKFYSKLSQSHISETDYKHAENVYEKLNCKSFLDCHLTYLK